METKPYMMITVNKTLALAIACLFNVFAYSQLIPNDTISLEKENVRNLIVKELIFNLISKDSVVLLDSNMIETTYTSILDQNTVKYRTIATIESLHDPGYNLIVEQRIKKSFLNHLIVRQEIDGLLLGLGFDIYNSEGSYVKNSVLFWILFP